MELQHLQRALLSHSRVRSGRTELCDTRVCFHRESPVTRMDRLQSLDKARVCRVHRGYRDRWRTTTRRCHPTLTTSVFQPQLGFMIGRRAVEKRQLLLQGRVDHGLPSTDCSQPSAARIAPTVCGLDHRRSWLAHGLDRGASIRPNRLAELLVTLRPRRRRSVRTAEVILIDRLRDPLHHLAHPTLLKALNDPHSLGCGASPVTTSETFMSRNSPLLLVARRASKAGEHAGVVGSECPTHCR